MFVATNGAPSPLIEVLYQDDYFVAVYKPSGLLVHRSPIDRRETQFALQRTRDQIGQRVYPVHRLDKPTCGVLLFALSSDAAHQMMMLFSAGQVHKRYLAVVRGHPDSTFCIDYPLIEQKDAMTDALASLDAPAQAAVTHGRCLAVTEIDAPVGRYSTARYALMELRPQHGRKHQLRRHMKHVFHPIVGDTTHGDGKHNRFFRDRFGCQRLLLSAVQLNFEHPFLRHQVNIESAPDSSFGGVIRALGWHTVLEPTRIHANIGAVLIPVGLEVDPPS
jgi:tRNA pseudouridine65 synthase